MLGQMRWCSSAAASARVFCALWSVVWLCGLLPGSEHLDTTDLLPSHSCNLSLHMYGLSLWGGWSYAVAKDLNGHALFGSDPCGASCLLCVLCFLGDGSLRLELQRCFCQSRCIFVLT